MHPLAAVGVRLPLGKASPSEQKVAKEVMRYFLHHPNATDSLEGISRWRLLQEHIEQTVAETHVAIRWLVEREFLEELRGQTSQPVFVLNRKNRAEAEQFAGIRGKRRK
jgi:hypothetical protein